MIHEVHIEAGGSWEMERRLPALRFNPDCEPRNVPAGTFCYTYPLGREAELEAVAREINVAFVWGIINSHVAATAIGGSFFYAVQSDNNLFDILNVNNPAAMLNVANYDLSTLLVSQVTPSAIATNAAGMVYIQNAHDAAIPTAPSFFVVYDVSVPLAVVQQGSINLGVPTAPSAFFGNGLVCKQAVVWSLLGGDGTANPATLRRIDVSNPLAPVATITVQIGTFLDQPRRIALDNGLIYILSGTPGKANQRIFVVDAATLLPVTLLEITDPLALAGLFNFLIRDGLIYLMAGTGLGGSVTNFLITTTAGRVISSQRVAPGPGGLAVAGRAGTNV